MINFFKRINNKGKMPEWIPFLNEMNSSIQKIEDFIEKFSHQKEKDTPKEADMSFDYSAKEKPTPEKSQIWTPSLIKEARLDQDLALLDSSFPRAISPFESDETYHVLRRNVVARKVTPEKFEMIRNLKKKNPNFGLSRIADEVVGISTQTIYHILKAKNYNDYFRKIFLRATRVNKPSVVTQEMFDFIKSERKKNKSYLEISRKIGISLTTVSVYARLKRFPVYSDNYSSKACGTKITPQLFERIKKSKEDNPNLTHPEIAKKNGVSETSVGRILRSKNIEDYLKDIRSSSVNIKKPRLINKEMFDFIKEGKSIGKTVAAMSRELGLSVRAVSNYSRMDSYPDESVRNSRIVTKEMFDSIKSGRESCRTFDEISRELGVSRSTVSYYARMDSYPGEKK